MIGTPDKLTTLSDHHCRRSPIEPIEVAVHPRLIIAIPGRKRPARALVEVLTAWNLRTLETLEVLPRKPQPATSPTSPPLTGSNPHCGHDAWREPPVCCSRCGRSLPDPSPEFLLPARSPRSISPGAKSKKNKKKNAKAKENTQKADSEQTETLENQDGLVEVGASPPPPGPAIATVAKGP